jgi:predicted flavoprotein YhiN
VPNNTVSTLSSLLSNSIFNVTGKSTFKEEFVSAGGVDLKEINFKTMESRLHKNLFFAGEVLNIDALTGGFNFQAAWTTAWIAAETISERIT